VIRYDPRTRRAKMRRRTFLRIALAGGTAFVLIRASNVLDRDAEGPLAPVLVVPPPPILTRAQWGADETKRKHDTKYDNRVHKIVVHHTATPNNDSDWAVQVRNIYDDELARGYSDMPYHLLIDPNGAIYEGRWARHHDGGEAPNGEDAQGRSVQGGHAEAHNERTLGIALLGTYSSSPPPTPAIDALVTVLVWKCGRWGIEPTGSSSFADDDGDAQMLPNIVPHSQLKATECPGLAMIDLLDDVRARTAAAIDLL